MDFGALIKTLQQRLDLPDLAGVAEGRVQFEVDGRFSIDVEAGPNGEGVILIARLGPIPAARRDETLKRMLELNLLERAASGAFLALDAAYDGMILCRRLDAVLDYPVFEMALERFITHAEGVQLSLTQAASAPADTAPQDWHSFALRA